MSSDPESIRLLALQEVWSSRHGEASGEYLLRRIMRDYSVWFHTPLHVVEELPVDDVLQAYWERHYEEIDEADQDSEEPGTRLDQIVRDSVMDRSKLDGQAKAEDSERAAADAALRAMKAREEGGDPQTPAVTVVKNASKSLQDTIKLLERFQDPKDRDPTLAEIPSDIEIQFSDELDFNDDEDCLGIREIPKKPHKD